MRDTVETYDEADDPRDPAAYGLALGAEEIGEILIALGVTLQVIGKGGRFGLDTPGMIDPLTGKVDMAVTPRTKLVEETGDLWAFIDYMRLRGVLNATAVRERRDYKLNKLLNPKSLDNLGRRLAP